MSDVAIREPGAVAVVDEWRGADAWITTVRLNGGDFSQETANTYAYHINKLRWYCEHIVKISPLQWMQKHANAFVQFLREFPDKALCAQIDTGRQRRNTNGRLKSIRRFAGTHEQGYTPFRTVPSASSRDDIVRCARALFEHWKEEGVIIRNPFAKIRSKKTRQLNVSRAVDLDLYQFVLDHMDRMQVKTEEAHRLRARDRFAFVALRELGLRASELVGAKMRNVYALSDPRSARTYWVIKVAEENAKGGVERTVPVTRAAMDALVTYRRAFGLEPLPTLTEPYGLLLSTRTAALSIGDKPVIEAQSRRYFKSWGSIGSRQTLYQIVLRRLSGAAQALRQEGRDIEADQLDEASPHWLRHTFAKAALLKGRELRVVAQSLGHASVNTTMAYTVQDALDQIREYERADAGDIATVSSTDQSTARERRP